MADEISVFISYSRTDTDFVDRLEADLRARGFKTWVDRRKLEGTREWQPQIDHAIAEYPMMIVVLSPDAEASPYVRHEYEYAHQLGKRIVTVLQKPNLPTMPPELSGIQWVDFVSHPYEMALVELIDGCQDPLFDQASDPRILYNQAHDLESADPERAAILYQRLLNRAPTYAGGRAQVDLDRLNRQLYTKRAQGLREQAESARKEGQYGAEAGALDALIALGDQDQAIFAWAKEYLPVAEQNREWLDTYENVKHFVATEPPDLDGARDLLAYLWQLEHAPFFRDPAGIAPTLGVKAPITYEQYKEQRLAGEVKARREKTVAAERDSLIAQTQSRAKAAIDEENAKWQSATAAIDRGHDGNNSNELRSKLPNWDPASDELVTSLIGHWRTKASIEKHLETVRSLAIIRNVIRENGLIGIVWPLAWIGIAAFFIAGVIADVIYNVIDSTLDNQFIAVAIFWVLLIGLPSSLFLLPPVLLVRLRVALARQEDDITALKSKWVIHASEEHTRRLSIVKLEENQLTSDAQLRCQQRMDEVATEYKRALADIAARYRE